ncbi:Kynurenine formamidase [Spirosomataceae bacterium TFI 002]|nr:Kynurenine formamidase [Spirosomataceae bacterium TFI 002]
MKVIDLTMTYSDKIAGFSRKEARNLENDGWNASELTIYSHAGTHMDAPFHFGVSEETIDKVDPKKYVGRAWLVDLSFVKESQLLQVNDFQHMASKIEKGDSLLLRTDWHKRLGTDQYRNAMPRISEELANWMVDKGVNMLGVEALSVADVNNLPEVTKIHEILLGGGITIIEGLCNLELIKEETVTLIALPIKFENGDGAPARVIAIENMQI